jgi:hypothetical protein
MTCHFPVPPFFTNISQRRADASPPQEDMRGSTKRARPDGAQKTEDSIVVELLPTIPEASSEYDVSISNYTQVAKTVLKAIKEKVAAKEQDRGLSRDIRPSSIGPNSTAPSSPLVYGESLLSQNMPGACHSARSKSEKQNANTESPGQLTSRLTTPCGSAQQEHEYDLPPHPDGLPNPWLQTFSENVLTSPRPPEARKLDQSIDTSSRPFPNLSRENGDRNPKSQ